MSKRKILLLYSIYTIIITSLIINIINKFVAINTFFEIVFGVTLYIFTMIPITLIVSSSK